MTEPVGRKGMPGSAELERSVLPEGRICKAVGVKPGAI